jgi:hypothetical protein
MPFVLSYRRSCGRIVGIPPNGWNSVAPARIDRFPSRGEIMTRMGISLKAIDTELAKRGFHALLEKGDGHFYFSGGEAADWPYCTVRVPTHHNLTLEQWMEPFGLMREKNYDLLTGKPWAPPSGSGRWRPERWQTECEEQARRSAGQTPH